MHTNFKFELFNYDTPNNMALRSDIGLCSLI